MDKEFVLYSTKMQGWVTAAGVYSSDYKQAKRYNGFEATFFIQNHFDDREKIFGVVPVRWQDLIDAVPSA